LPVLRPVTFIAVQPSVSRLHPSFLTPLILIPSSFFAQRNGLLGNFVACPVRKVVTGAIVSEVGGGAKDAACLLHCHSTVVIFVSSIGSGGVFRGGVWSVVGLRGPHANEASEMRHDKSVGPERNGSVGYTVEVEDVNGQDHAECRDSHRAG